MRGDEIELLGWKSTDKGRTNIEEYYFRDQRLAQNMKYSLEMCEEFVSSITFVTLTDERVRGMKRRILDSPIVHHTGNEWNEERNEFG